jgi:hypothetical protein
MINVIYRISDNGYKKPKFSNATKIHCLENAQREFGFANIHLFVDDVNLTNEVREMAMSPRSGTMPAVHLYTAGSSAGSFRHVFNYALTTFKSEDVVYFLEDDYLHLPNSATIMEEGMAIADYVSLYDHADKYIPASKGGNPFIEADGGEITKVFRTKSVHWKLTNSTTMTFATTISQLHQDADIWQKYTTGTHPHDMQIFLDLRDRGRSLITPLPGYSTHCEPQWASPGTDWEHVV